MASLRCIVAHARKGAPVPQGREEIHRQALEWRAKLIAELKRRPDWVRAWRDKQELDAEIEALCEERGLSFMPHECAPWDAPDQLPADYRASTGLGLGRQPAAGDQAAPAPDR
jgi:hypothetical protein